MSQQSGSKADQVQAIKQEVDDSLLGDAADAGVDVESIINSKLAKHDGYKPSTLARFVKTDIRQQIESASADKVQGIIMGSRDRYGKNWPRRHALLRSSGDHIEVSSWDGSLPGPDGDEIDIPVGGAMVTMRANFDEEYESWEAKGLEGVTSLDRSTLVEKLNKVAISPDDLTRNDEYETVVVKGTISYVDSQTLFDNDGNPDGEGPVLMRDARDKLQPHFEVTLGKEGDTSLRGHLERQKNGRPYLAVEDLVNLVEDAHEMHDTPEQQASFIRAGMQGVDVILVGNVNSYNTNRNDGEVTNYVDLGLTAIVQADAPEKADIQDSVDQETDDTGTDDAAEDTPAGGTEEADIDDEDVPETTESASADAPVDEVAEQIEQYANLVGEDVGGLTVSDIQENAKGIDAPESVIQFALGKLGEGSADAEDDGEQAGEDDSDGGAEPESEESEGGGDSDDSDDGGSQTQTLSERYAALQEADMFQCPADGGDCPGKGTSVTDLIGHIVDEHDPESAAEARDFLDDRV